MRLVCTSEDACYVTASYILPLRRDHHDVQFKWQTYPAPGYPNTNAGTLLRTRSSGVGQPVSIAGVATGYRYVGFDLVWHSDIRCDVVWRPTSRVWRQHQTGATWASRSPAHPTTPTVLPMETCPAKSFREFHATGPVGPGNVGADRMP